MADKPKDNHDVDATTAVFAARTCTSGDCFGDCAGDSMGLEGTRLTRRLSNLLIVLVLLAGFDPAIRRFESFHPSQFSVCDGNESRVPDL